MSTFISEPGTRLGGRYRLEDRINAGSGWAAWKAIDETLARAVSVLTFARGFPRITDAVTAARAASRLTDARLAQVFDVEEDWDHAYVVMEWVGGDSLDDLLADGPLDPAQGAEIIAQSAEALAVAHAAGVAHLCLAPSSLHWTTGGGIKIVGLGIDAALAGVTADDPALADTQSLGRLLYGALTGHWPGGDWPSLPPAPEVDGHLRSPRQVRAGVPAGIDDVCCQVLLPDTHGRPPITTPATLATALNRVIPAPAAPPPITSPRGYTTGMSMAGLQQDSPYRTRPDGPSRHGRGTMSGRPPAGTRVMATIAVVLVAAAVGVGVWLLGHHGAPPKAGSTPSTRPTHAAPLQTILTPVSAAAFGPNGGDNPSEAPLAIDNKPGTDWQTDQYKGSPFFGNLYSGTGLMIDMGKRVPVSKVTVTFGDVPGGHVRIEVGNSNQGSTPSGFTTLAHSNNATGTMSFSATTPVKGQFVLIWFTKLPPSLQADVFNVVVRGSP
jgi:hypothetical protein